MKTIEEKLNFYLNLPIDKEHHLGFKLGFIKGIEFTLRWIPVEEELPETNEFGESKICLVKNKYRIDIGRYYSYQKRWFPTDMEVTYWRQIEMD